MGDEVIEKVTQAINEFSFAVGSQTLSQAAQQVKPIDGNPNSFKDWLREIEKQSALHNFNDEKKIRLVRATTKGAVADFVERWTADVDGVNNRYDRLIYNLKTNFSNVTDSEHARALLRHVRQRQDEPVTVYSERLFALAKDAYADTNMDNAGSKAIVEKQIVAYFIDGLIQDSIKIKLLRSNPATVTEALRIAVDEQNLRKHFALRSNRNFDSVSREFESRIEIPMDVNHARERRCAVCLRKGHTARYCKQRRVMVNEINKPRSRLDNTVDRHPRRCWFCGSTNHIMSQCEAYHNPQPFRKSPRKDLNDQTL